MIISFDSKNRQKHSFNNYKVRVFTLMLKKIIALMGVCVLSLSVHADTYNFNGIITSVTGPDVPYNIGDEFNFIIEIDFESQGYRTGGGGVEILANTADYTYYAAEYISGDAVENVGWDFYTEHFYFEPVSSGSASIDVLNNLAVFSSGVLSIDSWNSENDIVFAQEWRNDTFIYNGIFGEITSFTVDVDTDGDGVLDATDNCTLVSNPGQQDADGDGHGNLCDADVDNNCVISFLDISLFSAEFLGSNPVFDFDSSGAVNFADFAIMTGYFLLPPGPSAAGTCT